MPAGLKQDATVGERRKAAAKLKFLTNLTNSCIHRSSADVLEKALPPKTEAVLLLDMSEPQRALYTAYTEFLQVRAKERLRCSHVPAPDVAQAA